MSSGPTYILSIIGNREFLKSENYDQTGCTQKQIYNLFIGCDTRDLISTGTPVSTLVKWRRRC